MIFDDFYAMLFAINKYKYQVTHVGCLYSAISFITVLRQTR